MTREQILDEAMSLEPDDREAIAEKLLSTLSNGDHAAIDAAWLAEARRREGAFARGEMSTSPVDDVVARVRSRGRTQ